MIRKPAVAGQFYSATREAVTRHIKSFDRKVAQKLPCIGGIVPHAGYMYSGSVAGELYSSIEITPTVIILAPNHRGPLVPFAMSPADSWNTPLGDVAVDQELAGAIIKAFPALELDAAPHEHEHSAEVQVPFLQYFRPDVKIVPIVIAEQDYEPLAELGAAIANAVTGKNVLILASSDMTHFQNSGNAKRLDTMALDKVLALDPQGLHKVVHENDISMCGIAPAVAMLNAVIKLGAKNAELVRYANSGDVTGDFNSVVGYAAVRIF
jgi:MEMO1 family protein